MKYWKEHLETHFNTAAIHKISENVTITPVDNCGADQIYKIFEKL